jgi:prepilin-type N-terminal cleavage/methylation domain-containing protein
MINLNNRVASKQYGFTLIELLVVMGIISILVAIAIGAYRQWRDAENFRAAQRTIFETLNQARSDARRQSRSQIISWAGETGNSELEVCTSNGSCQTVAVPHGAIFDVIDGPNTQFTYLAPFGRKNAAEIEWLISSRNNARKAKVRVVGVTGKAVLTTCDPEALGSC